MVDLLLNGGANINDETYEDRRTALHRATEHGYDGIVRLLLTHSTNTSTRTRKGKTALDLASGNEEITQLILSRQN